MTWLSPAVAPVFAAFLGYSGWPIHLPQALAGIASGRESDGGPHHGRRHRPPW
jgi:hypothetical protein